MFKQWHEILTKCVLFENIPIESLNHTLNCFNPKIVSYKKNSFVGLAGDPLEGIGVVLSGKVAITKESADGERIIMSMLNPSEIFAEIITFAGIKTYLANVEAREDSTIMFLSPLRILDTCQNTCESHKLIASNTIRVISKKAVMLNRKVEYLAIKSLRGKICNYLYDQYKIFKQPRFTLAFNRNELADFLNVTRPSLSRELGRMKEEGIIDYHSSDFHIMDLEELRHYL